MRKFESSLAAITFDPVAQECRRTLYRDVRCGFALVFIRLSAEVFIANSGHGQMQRLVESAKVRLRPWRCSQWRRIMLTGTQHMQE